MDINHELQTSDAYSENQIYQSIMVKATSNNDREIDENDEENCTSPRY